MVKKVGGATTVDPMNLDLFCFEVASYHVKTNKLWIYMLSSAPNVIVRLVKAGVIL